MWLNPETVRFFRNGEGKIQEMLIEGLELFAPPTFIRDLKMADEPPSEVTCLLTTL